jgi:hypothetical protein
LLAHGAYGDVLPRFVGVLMLALGALVSQIIRHRVEALYPATIAIRVGIWVAVLWLYVRSGDPLFLMILGVVGLGIALTAASYLVERRP